MDWIKIAVGPALAIIGLVAGFYYFHANRRRTTVRFLVVAQRIISSKAAHGSLEVAYDGKTIKDPYLINIEILNTGPKDVRSKDFDQDAPLRVEIGVPIITLIVDKAAKPNPINVSIDEEAIEIGPALLRKDERHTINAIVDGKPAPEVNANLADADVRISGSADSPGGWLRSIAESTTGAIALGAIMIVVGIFGASQIPAGWPGHPTTRNNHDIQLIDDETAEINSLADQLRRAGVVPMVPLQTTAPHR
jgi:hypothetical protein